MQKALSILFLTTTLLFAESTMAQSKVVVIPLSSNSAAGTDGQIQFNDNGREAGAELYYDKATKTLKTDGEVHIRDDAGYGIGLSYHIPSYGGESFGAILKLAPGDNAEVISIFPDRLLLTPDKVGIGKAEFKPLATLDVNGYVKLKPYDSAPVSCTTSMRGTIVMNDDYDLCVCRAAVLGSAFKLVRDTNLNCW